jgi:hypothetical protein
MSGVVSFVGAPQSVSGANGGKIYADNNLANNPHQIAPPNPNRRSIVFHNPGTSDVYVTMVYQMSQNGTQLPNGVNIESVGGAFRIVPAATLVFNGGEIQAAWLGFGPGDGNPITVMDSNA